MLFLAQSRLPEVSLRYNHPRLKTRSER